MKLLKRLLTVIIFITFLSNNVFAWSISAYSTNKGGEITVNWSTPGEWFTVTYEFWDWDDSVQDFVLKTETRDEYFWADTYYIYLNNSLKTMVSNTNSYIFSALNNGSSYNINIIAKEYDYELSGYYYIAEAYTSSTPYDTTNPSTPNISHADVDSNNDGVNPEYSYDDDTSLYFSWTGGSDSDTDPRTPKWRYQAEYEKDDSGSYTRAVDGSATSYTITAENGHYYRMWVRTIDDSGNTSNWISTVDIDCDTEKPSNLTVSITNFHYGPNGGLVDLNLSVTDNLAYEGLYMSFSNNNSTWSNWEAYTTTKKDYNLGAGSGTKYVYVRVKDKAGNISNTASANMLIEKGQLKIVVQEKSYGTPVEEAKVVVNTNITIKEDIYEKGVYIEELSSGTYPFYIEKPGFETLAGQANIETGRLTEIVVELVRKFKPVKGMVLDMGGDDDDDGKLFGADIEMIPSPPDLPVGFFSTYTDFNGSFTLNVMADHEYKIKISRFNYITYEPETAIYISADQSTGYYDLGSINLEYAYNDRGDVEGHTKESGTGNIMPNVPITIKDAHNTITPVTSAQNGSFISPALTPGRYKLQAVKNGYVTSEQIVDIEARKSVYKSIDLSPRATQDYLHIHDVELNQSATYSARRKIKIGPNVVVKAGVTILCIAGEEVEIIEWARTEDGAYFNTAIDPALRNQ